MFHDKVNKKMEALSLETAESLTDAEVSSDEEETSSEEDSDAGVSKVVQDGTKTPEDEANEL